MHLFRTRRLSDLVKTSAAASLAAAAICAAPVSAEPLLVSTLDNLDATLFGILPVGDGDVAEVDGMDASIFFSESTFTSTAAEDIDAFHVLDDGRYLVSVLFNGRILGGVTFDDADVVIYDPVTDTGEISSLNESLFSGVSPDVDAVTVLPSGNWLFSVRGDDQVGAVTFTDGDIVEFDPVTLAMSVYLSEAELVDDGDCDVDCLHFEPDGSLLIGFAADEVINGITYPDGDVLRRQPGTGVVSVVFSENNWVGADGFAISGDTNAVARPLGGCPCDADGSGVVDLNDYFAYLGDFFAQLDVGNPQPGSADIDGSGVVDVNDYFAFLGCFFAALSGEC